VCTSPSDSESARSPPRPLFCAQVYSTSTPKYHVTSQFPTSSWPRSHRSTQLSEITSMSVLVPVGQRRGPLPQISRSALSGRPRRVFCCAPSIATRVEQLHDPFPENPSACPCSHQPTVPLDTPVWHRPCLNCCRYLKVHFPVWGQIIICAVVPSLSSRGTNAEKARDQWPSLMYVCVCARVCALRGSRPAGMSICDGTARAWPSGRRHHRPAAPGTFLPAPRRRPPNG
jgi:hypothetical protein